MKTPPTHAPFASGALTRHSTGLTPAHVELIQLLAKVAVENYLAEVEAAETASQPEIVAAQREEVIR
jgi:hypothetical protein